VTGITRFGIFRGEEVSEITLATEAGAQAKIITWGAVVRDLVVPSPYGPQRVVLGLNTIEDYAAHSPYFGAIVGRYANRIGNGRFILDGCAYELDRNQKNHQLHGGTAGFGRRIWSIAARSKASVTLALVSEHGDMGYPGRLVAVCTYTLLEPATLRVVLEATCDAPTPVSLTTHGYYNLDGSSDVLEHRLMIAGDLTTSTDQDLIPTGEIRLVEASSYDFRTPRAIGDARRAGAAVNYDINYVLRHARGELARAATLSSPKSGVSLDLWTTEPGLQFYDGHLLDMPVPGLDGRPYTRNGGLCLEPQRFPDGPNKPHFPPCILRPGEVSRQVSEMRFGPAT
jgi:aldose 1-epimerase